jgi:hypothetical protein
MNLFKLKLFYFAWHYSYAIQDYFIFTKNILWFIWHFFSVKTLLKTFFQPFKKMRERYRGGFNIENFFEALIITTLMRLVGMFLRSILIFIGIITWLSFLLVGFLGFIIWILLPFILIFVFVAGILTFFKT